MLWGYHLLLQKSENLKYHLTDCTGFIILGDSKYNFHRYLDGKRVNKKLGFASLVVGFFYPSKDY